MATQETVKDVIVNILGVNGHEITPEADLRKDLGADSLDIVEISMELESEFSIKIPDEHLELITTVQDIYTYINKRVKEKNA